MTGKRVVCDNIVTARNAANETRTSKQTMTAEQINQDNTVYRFRGVSKPTLTWGKDRGKTVHGDFLGHKRVEWVEKGSSCFQIFLVELSDGERFEVSEEDHQRADRALSFQVKKFFNKN